MTIAISLTAIFISTFSIVLSLIAIIEYRSFKKSTHNIQYVPAEEMLKEQPSVNFDEEIAKDFDNVM